MSYTPLSMEPIRVESAQRKPLTEEDVAMRRKRLERLGLQDGLMGRVNDWSGTMLKKRDDLISSVMGSAAKAGAQSGALSSGAASAAGGAGMLSSL